MIYYIGSARHDENGRYTGGRKGDQTGQEVATQKMYDYFSKGGWICFRFKSPYNAVAMKQAMLRACANDHIGYSQSDRYGVIRNGVDTNVDTNCDCSTLIRACIKEACGTDVGDFTTASEAAALEKSGLFVNVGKVTTRSILYEGDILVTAKKGHTAALTTGHDRMDAVMTSSKATIAMLRNKGLKYAMTFCKGITITENKDVVLVKVLQHALNLDYNAGLKEDGAFGERTNKALGTHYVKQGEKQYLVSAAEIMCYMRGSDPNGFEVPGVYGKGLKKATGLKKLDADWFKRMM